jgi:diguanylate cyclase (GGDEF)-like protein
VRTPQGLSDVYIGTISDVTEFHQHAQRFEYRANHDVLTGLLNRERFEHRLNEALTTAEEQGRSIAVLFLDLNRFKPINDTHGHSSGDLVLKAVAVRLRNSLRNDDVVARIGGDEFAVLLPNAPERGTVDQILAKLVRSIALPIHIGSCHVKVSCSAGVARFPDDGTCVQSLLDHADRAMYQHKFKDRDPVSP